ncbi:MAG: hypothetical protein N3F05_03490 [Candidatus Diapherotrites archaeon]|nr:hypothetical protein [Candidatus Diapherotrites archaeon]
MAGSFIEQVMYKATEKKLRQLCAKNIKTEQSVSLSPRRTGSYDIFAEINGSFFGFEILCRPTKGKLREKLAYLPFVDKYVFVIPSNSLSLYRKCFAKSFGPITRPKYFPSEFNNKKLCIWLCDIEKRKITVCSRFNKVMNVSTKNRP